MHVLARLVSRWSIVAIVAAFISGCAAHTQPSAGVERDRLLERQSGFLAALSAQDAGMVAAHFAEDAVVHVDNMAPIVGRDAIYLLYESVFRFLSDAEYAPDKIRIAANADIAYGTGHVTNIFEQAEGLIEYPGKYLVVWEKRDGVWMVTAYSVSSHLQ